MMLEKLNNEFIRVLDDVKIDTFSKMRVSGSYDEVTFNIIIKDDKYILNVDTKEENSKNLVCYSVHEYETLLVVTIYVANVLSKTYKEVRALNNFKLYELYEYDLKFTLDDILLVDISISYDELETNITRLDTKEKIMHDEVFFYDEIKEVCKEMLESVKTM